MTPAVSDLDILVCFARAVGENKADYLVSVGRAILDLGDLAAGRQTPPNRPVQGSVSAAVDGLVDALAVSKGWMRDYARAIVEDAVDRVQLSRVTLATSERAALIRAAQWMDIPADGSTAAMEAAQDIGVLRALAARLLVDFEGA
ncbi:hypothetical protein [Variovorax sp. PBL-H6]|uniref:hypothetical protein n=1 Tax=Variovorax sp. PBL-H6 TaxID=434009 RepID=UPI00076DBBA9|nr:hypothetical protein [Variovorax sp. PBL-H6]KWT98041.1 hypothetical protein APY03_0712 [Variovorax sp. WDL1]